ncbi:MAG: hypothetical protein ABW223_09780 [Rariglobus sp.]
MDPANSETARDPIDILLPPSGNAPRELNPAFRAIRPTFAVALGKLGTDLPFATPVAWTRGLQPDGTWAKHSPYGGEGGFITFLGGNVSYFRNLSDDGGQLISRDGAKTANILDALPPGTRIGEYMPTAEEQKTWSAAKRPPDAYPPRSSVFWPGVLLWILVWAPFLIVSIHRRKKAETGVFSIFIWPAAITLLILMIAPTVAH